jgi:hypothetical protein
MSTAMTETNSPNDAKSMDSTQFVNEAGRFDQRDIVRAPEVKADMSEKKNSPLDTQTVMAKVAAMSPAEHSARIDEIYTIPEVEMTPELTAEFLALTTGSIPDELPSAPYPIRLTPAECVALDAALAAKVAAMTPAERIERRQQIIDAPPSEAGDREFAALLFYPVE